MGAKEGPPETTHSGHRSGSARGEGGGGPSKPGVRVGDDDVKGPPVDRRRWPLAPALRACRLEDTREGGTLQNNPTNVAQRCDEATAGADIALAAGMHCLLDQVVHEHSIDTQSRRIYRGGHSACSPRFRKLGHRKKKSEAERHELLGASRLELHTY